LKGPSRAKRLRAWKIEHEQEDQELENSNQARITKTWKTNEQEDQDLEKKGAKRPWTWEVKMQQEDKELEKGMSKRIKSLRSWIVTKDQELEKSKRIKSLKEKKMLRGLGAWKRNEQEN